MGESYITAGGYFNLNLNAGSDPDVTERRGKLFQGSIVREKKENLLVLSRTKGLVRVNGWPRVTECGRSVKKSVESR